MNSRLCCFFLLALGVFALIRAFMFLPCRRKLEMLPGLNWEYYTDNYSRLIWDDVGIVAIGRFDVVLCDYGLCVFSSDENDSCYLDLREHCIKKISDAGTNLWDKVGIVIGVDATSAMGVYSDAAKESFEQALVNLKERLRYVD